MSYEPAPESIWRVLWITLRIPWWRPQKTITAIIGRYGPDAALRMGLRTLLVLFAVLFVLIALIVVNLPA